MSVNTVANSELLSDNKNTENTKQPRSTQEMLNHSIGKDSNKRKRSFLEVTGDSPKNSAHLDDDIEELSDTDEFMDSKKKTKTQKSQTQESSEVPNDIETWSIDSEDSDEEEDSEKEEIEILSETKLDKAELLRREQKFRKLSCPVCLDTPEPMIATQCGHLFCCDCIIRALASSKSKSVHSGVCPVCRKTVRYKDLQILSIKHLQ